MKTLFTSAMTLFIGAGLLIVSPAMAQNNRQATAYYAEKTFEIGIFPAAAPSKMWVHVDKKGLNRPVRVELLNQRGQVLATEWYPKKQPVVCARFDLSAVDDGIYTFRITDGQQTQERIFKLATPGFEEQLPKRLITMSAPVTASTTNTMN